MEHDSLEPASTASGQPEAGSARSGPTLAGDLLRASIVAALLAICIASPGSALVVLPFVPAIVALRLLQPAAARTFLITVGALSAIVAVWAPDRASWLEPATIVITAIGSVALLGTVHAHAARRDGSGAASADSDWPEPRVDTGLAPVLVAWSVLAAAAVTVADLTLPRLRAAGAHVVDLVYRANIEACGPDGMFADNTAVCDALTDQRDSVLAFVTDNAALVFAAALAVVVLCSAATTHLFVMWRARQRHAELTRPYTQLRRFEAHWAWIYVGTVGVLLLVAAPSLGSAELLTRSIGTFLATLVALLLVLQGFGLISWWAARVKLRIWQRVFLVLGAYLTLRYSLPIIAALGMLDIALHPRRRSSGSLTGRGSGS